MKEDDYYKILGVAKTASQEEIQKAHRLLARKYHPDFNQDDPKAKEKFQKVQEAFDILKDPEKRRVYDQYGVSPDQLGSGGGHGPFGWSFTGGTPGRKANFKFEDIGDFMHLFGGGFGGASPEEIFSAGRDPRQGRDVEQTLTIPFALSITGGKIDVIVGGKTVSVTIPAGIVDGKKLFLRGLGETAPKHGMPGNLFLTIRVKEHPSCFSFRGGSLYVDVPITLKEAVFGAKIDVPTPKGNVILTIPPGATSGTKLRIKNCGVGESGDLFAVLQIALPPKWSEQDKTILEKLQTEPEEPVRSKLSWN